MALSLWKWVGKWIVSEARIMGKHQLYLLHLNHSLIVKAASSCLFLRVCLFVCTVESCFKVKSRLISILSTTNTLLCSLYYLHEQYIRHSGISKTKGEISFKKFQIRTSTKPFCFFIILYTICYANHSRAFTSVEPLTVYFSPILFHNKLSLAFCYLNIDISTFACYKSLKNWYFI